jgi:hypothetical protein
MSIESVAISQQVAKFVTNTTVVVHIMVLIRTIVPVTRTLVIIWMWLLAYFGVIIVVTIIFRWVIHAAERAVAVDGSPDVLTDIPFYFRRVVSGAIRQVNPLTPHIGKRLVDSTRLISINEI